MPYPVSTSIHLTADPAYVVPYENQIKRITDGGFRFLDFNFLDLTNSTASPFVGKDWLSIPWMVYHAIYTEDPDWMRINHRAFDRIVELSKKYGVGVAFENTWVKLQSVPLWQTEALIELCDSYHDPIVGICWDTGHGNVCGGDPALQQYTNQYKEITKLGKRLIALHIDDNNGIDDDHVAPFEGKSTGAA